MTIHRMILVQESIQSGMGQFFVDSASPEEAATTLFAAHETARKALSQSITLEDGQSQCLEPTSTIKTRIFCVVIDDNGREVAEIHSEA